MRRRLSPTRVRSSNLQLVRLLPTVTGASLVGADLQVTGFLLGRGPLQPGPTMWWSAVPATADGAALRCGRRRIGPEPADGPGVAAGLAAGDYLVIVKVNNQQACFSRAWCSVTRREPVAFVPSAGGTEVLARYWLRQVTLRLRREVCWLWRERQAQGVFQTLPSSGSNGLPPFVDPALGALDLARYEHDKRTFFADDITARHLSELIAEPAPDVAAPRRGSFGWVVHDLALGPAESFVLALGLLPAVDSAAGAVIAACINEPGRGEPTLALSQRLWDEPDELLRCFDPGHALFSHGLLAQTSDGKSLVLQGDNRAHALTAVFDRGFDAGAAGAAAVDPGARCTGRAGCGRAQAARADLMQTGAGEWRAPAR